MIIREALRRAEEILLDAGVPDARLDAEYLLAGVLDAPRLLVVASGETPLTDARAEWLELEEMHYPWPEEEEYGTLCDDPG